MCTAAISHLVMSDAIIQEKMSDPLLDMIHKQVVMVLYSLDADKRLPEFREWLPIYLSREWSECAPILETIEAAGLIKRTQEGIALTHRIEVDGMDMACGCQ
jgi:hypothetical protein